jgi:DNA mismatch repair protein MutS
MPDMDRALSRLALDRGGPRDLAAVRNGLAQAQRSRPLGMAATCRVLRGGARTLTGHDDAARSPA